MSDYLHNPAWWCGCTDIAMHNSIHRVTSQHWNAYRSNQFVSQALWRGILNEEHKNDNDTICLESLSPKHRKRIERQIKKGTCKRTID